MKTSTLVLAATKAAVTLPALSSAASAYACKDGSIKARAVEPIRFKAKAKAKKNWSTRVRNARGLSWSVWKIAQAKSVQCDKLGHKQWRCWAKARPCQYVVQ